MKHSLKDGTLLERLDHCPKNGTIYNKANVMKKTQKKMKKIEVEKF